MSLPDWHGRTDCPPVDRMHHLPFVQHLAAIDEDSDDWNGIGLALRALILVDAGATARDASIVIAADALLADAVVGDDNDSIVEAVRAIAALLGRRDLDRRSTGLSSALLALTALFRRRCLYELARDTARAALRQAPIDSDNEWLAHRECGCAEMWLGNFKPAADHYGACVELGQRLGTSDAVFWGRNGHCQLVKQRGNLPRAEAMYERLANWGRRIGRPDIEAHARHALGITIGIRGRLREGLAHVEAALPASTESERIRVLTNIAYMRLQLGEQEQARDTFMEVVRVAKDRYEANVAHVNLIELFGAAGNRDEVEAHRAHVEHQRLPAILAVDFQMTLGRAYVALRDSVSAASCFRRAAEVAHRARLGRDIIEADRELERLGHVAGLGRDRSTWASILERDVNPTRAERFAVRLLQ